MPNILHFGLGNFHRAHQAFYTVNTGWKITGVVMSNRKLYDEMLAADMRYRLEIWNADGIETQDIEIYDRVLLATDQSQQIIATIANPETQVITLTITEKGYFLDDDGKHLNLEAASIAADLSSEVPKTAIGLLTSGLMQRSKSGTAPITVISCDNLSENSSKLKQVLLDYVGNYAPDLNNWIVENVSFPNSMVDRITPKLTRSNERKKANQKQTHALPIVRTEKFSEWVVENNFAGKRPDWDLKGAVFADDIASYEERKLRLLNAAHSYLAYSGLLKGHTFVHEAIADVALLKGVNKLWDEAQTTVSTPANETISHYRQSLLQRFSVPQMQHQLSQIAMDGSLKIKERLVPIISQRGPKELESQAAISAIGAWIIYVLQRITQNKALDDPNSEDLTQFLKHGLNSKSCALISEFIGLPTIVHDELYIHTQNSTHYP